MLTREQIEEIQTERRKKGISIKKLLKERGIPKHQYFFGFLSLRSGLQDGGYVFRLGRVVYTIHLSSRGR